MSARALAAIDARLRPLLVRLPPSLAVRLYSRGRRVFLERLLAERPAPVAVPPELAATLWGVRFRAPLLNAAGMWKDGRGYDLAVRQGAGGFLAGTTTARPRGGNRRRGVAQPFAPYPRSAAASNWLGLPNPGHAAVARRLAEVERAPGCPVGASVAADAEEGIVGLVAGMRLYADAGVDFLELNESCPNTGDDPGGIEELRERLARVAEGFLARRARPLPVVLKLGCDTALHDVPELVDLAVDLDFDGLDFGNTSTEYAALRPAIARRERRLYDAFARRFGGGVSGRPLRERSLALVAAAAKRLRARPPRREVCLVRTGGVASAADVAEAGAAGAALCGWLTGYFDAFSAHGHALYAELWRGLLRHRPARAGGSPAAGVG